MSIEPNAAVTLVGARANNLADVDLRLPLHTWTAITGVSGSGKSSLVFDTLAREGRRRFLEASSLRARQALGKLGAADVDSLTGLPVPMAIGAGRMTRSARSTVGTLSGIADLLRLVWARDSLGGPYDRSAFSFNSAGACPTCTGRGEVADIDVERLVVHPERSIRAGALGPTLPNGYTVYSQVTVDVLNDVCGQHGFDVDTPWNELTPEQHAVIFEGSTAIEVPFGKHSLESRLKWEGITARPRDVGFYRGLLPVMRETLERTPNPNILRYARSISCPTCQGTRLDEPGRTATLGDLTLPALCRVPLRDLVAALAPLRSPVLDAVRTQITDRTTTAVGLGLGHLALSRPSTTLSDGELQRTRLLAQLGIELGGMLLAFDEPTLGLHPSAHAGLQGAFERLLDLGNTLITVEHDPLFVSAASHLVTMGPEAGSRGGEIVYDGPLPDRPLGRPTSTTRNRPGRGDLTLRDARLHGLHTDVTFLTAALNVVMGPSGAGKTSLVFGCLHPALRGEQGPWGAVVGHEGLTVKSVDARPLGATARSTLATYTGLLDPLRKAFAALPSSRAAKLTASHFSHNAKAGRCPDCEGRGSQSVGLHLMSDVETVCATCGGGRYQPDVLAVRLREHTIADVLQLTVDAAHALLNDLSRVGPLLDALRTLGLGYLQLGRSSTTLSRGEAQRVKLAALLATRGAPSVLLLDEPDRGLHPVDLDRLLVGLHALVDAGHTLVVVSHHPTLWGAADHLVEVVDGHASLATLPTLTPRAPRRTAPEPPDAIRLVGVRTHNLRAVDVTFPHRALSVVCGRSGSGKSSLVFDTLAAEGERRFAETLPFQVRRFMRRLPAPDLDAATGLTPTVALRQQEPLPDDRSTVGTHTGIGPLLRLLLAREGRPDAGLTAEHFARSRPLGRCETCEGRQTTRHVDLARLLTAPDQSVCGGAFAGTKPGRFFTEPTGRHVALLAAHVDVGRPWSALPASDQHIVLHGHPDVVTVTWAFKRGRRTGEHTLTEPWRGLVPLIEGEERKRRTRKDHADWLAPFAATRCASCSGSGLASPARDVLWGGYTLHGLQTMALADLRGVLAATPTRLGPLVERLLALVDALLTLEVEATTDTRIRSLSAGQRQRVRLAGVLSTGSTGLTVVLDEPGAGLDDDGVAALVGHLHALRDEGNTVVVVSHDARLLQAADHLIELGPGAGPDGGRITAVGPAVLAGSGPTAVGLQAPIARLPTSVTVVGSRIALADWARQHGHAPTSAPSGTTLAFALGWMPLIQRAFRNASGLSASAFSHHSPKGRCPRCKGAGVESVALDVLADLRLPCPDCGGRRYLDEVLAIRIADRSIADVLQGPIEQLTAVVPALADRVEHARRLGLAHLPVGARLSTLSGGERQRLVMLVALHERPPVLTLDDPTRGLHAADLPGWLAVLDTLADQTSIALTTTDRRLRAAPPAHEASSP